MTRSASSVLLGVSGALTTSRYLGGMRTFGYRTWPSAVMILLCRLLAAFLVIGFPQVAMAQTVTTYTSPTDGAINGTTTCAAPLVRNFTVGGTSFTVADVDLGFFATHTWRGDIRLTLQHPDGTRVQLVDGDANSTSGDNLNVRLNDGGTQVVNTDSATGNHSTAAPPPFANNFIPNAPLTAFSGKAVRRQII